MKIRSYESGDFSTLMHFWTQKGLQEIPEDFIPPIGRVVVRDEGTLLAAAFLVQSDGGMAAISFVCGNPMVEADERGAALSILLIHLRDLAREIGYRFIGASTNVPALQKRFERLGLTPTDRDVVCYGGLL